jgi:hypothetical protein
MPRAHHRSSAAAERPARGAQAGSATRSIGALALLAVGIAHIEQYYVDSYRCDPHDQNTVRPDFASATLVALGLALPLQRLARRWGSRLVTLLALTAIAIAAGSLAGLVMSETGTLFGFRQIGYRTPVVASTLLKAATTISLTAFLIAKHRTAISLLRTALVPPGH